MKISLLIAFLTTISAYSMVLELPVEYKNTTKEVIKEFEKSFKPNNQEERKKLFRYLVDRDGIKESLLPKTTNNLIVRIYIRKNININSQEKLKIGDIEVTTQNAVSNIGIQIGDAIIYWCENNFAIITNASEKDTNFLAVFHPEKNQESVFFVENKQQILDEVAKFIQEYNCLKKYTKFKYNSQNFLRGLLKTINLSFFHIHNGPICEFYDYILSPENKIDKEFFFIMNGKIHHSWSSHSDLDNWQNQYPNFAATYKTLLDGLHLAAKIKGENGNDCPCNQYVTETLENIEKIEKFYENNSNVINNEKINNYFECPYSYLCNNSNTFFVNQCQQCNGKFCVECTKYQIKPLHENNKISVCVMCFSKINLLYKKFNEEGKNKK